VSQSAKNPSLRGQLFSYAILGFASLKSFLNRTYNSLEWCLNSPPKPHSFVSLPIKSYINFYSLLMNFFSFRNWFLIVEYSFLILISYTIRLPLQDFLASLALPWAIYLFFIILINILISFIVYKLFSQPEYVMVFAYVIFLAVEPGVILFNF